MEGLEPEPGASWSFSSQWPSLPSWGGADSQGWSSSPEGWAHADSVLSVHSPHFQDWHLHGGSSAGARGARVGAWPGPGYVLGQYWHASQSSDCS